MWFCKLNWLHYQFNAMNTWWWTSGRKKFILGYFLIEKSICGIGLTNSIPKLGIFLNEVNVNIIKKMVKNNRLYNYFLKKFQTHRMTNEFFPAGILRYKISGHGLCQNETE